MFVVVGFDFSCLYFVNICLVCGCFLTLFLVIFVSHWQLLIKLLNYVTVNVVVHLYLFTEYNVFVTSRDIAWRTTSSTLTITTKTITITITTISTIFNIFNIFNIFSTLSVSLGVENKTKRLIHRSLSTRQTFGKVKQQPKSAASTTVSALNGTRRLLSHRVCVVVLLNKCSFLLSHLCSSLFAFIENAAICLFVTTDNET